MGARAAIPYELVYERLPSGVLVADVGGRVVHANPAAAGLLGPVLGRAGVTCCELFGCGVAGTPLAAGCITELALSSASPTPEVRVQTPRAGHGPSAVWLTAVATGAMEPAVVLQLRRAPPGDRRRRAETDWVAGSILRIHTLGRVHLEIGGAPLAGEWLAHRPGELLKYLIVARGRPVSVEELLETFWSDGGRASATNVRQAIHTLRDRLEPRRQKHRPSPFVVARRGGYELDRDRVWIDADDFEHAARLGLEALNERRPADAEPRLQRAAALYHGDFLAEDPYAEWALGERERLRDLAAKALHGLATLRVRRDDPEAALEPLRRLADIEPFDERLQRELLEQLLRVGRHAEAQRRYQLMRRRFRRAFGADPDWALTELLHA